MTYEEALEYVHGLERFGVKLGPERTQELLRRVGRPERRAGRIIHVTGTSGKGSVAALVEAALRAAGYRVGLYTSPALERFNDRMQIDRREIDDAELAALVGQVAPHVSAMVAEGLEQPTEFEVITVVAFLYFAAHQLDWLVLEVGVGGRFDATNVVEAPVITCITNIGLDHTKWLGATHEAIAQEKAGIIKPGTPCVTGTQHSGALATIRAEAAANNADLIEVTDADCDVEQHTADGQVVRLLGARGWYREVGLSLLGRHQAANAVVALRVLELAGLPEPAIRAGFADVVWPGRFEILRLPGLPVIVLDAAHNPAKCEALAQAMRDYFPGQPVTLVLGALADKNVTAMARPLLEQVGRVWTTTPESPRRLDAAGLAEICSSLGHAATAEADISAAVEQALAATGPSGVVLITGSFYTVGPARKHLRARMGRE
ncbi:MAG TPA: folylpolyglutamate synthase/dihydrofolate synthase family protein [Symbiobacteriaceae bacterium]|jgi:dihydrofolate synthase/folylpolyglutamate synthase